MLTINPDRLLADLHALRRFGACGNGVVRTTFSEADLASRKWLLEQFSNAGLESTIDGIGNVFGISKNSGKAMLVGSHSDTQPTGGWLDGSLGVIYGLEVARALSECNATRDLPVDIVSWADEEASFLGLLGSRSFCGLLESEQINQASGRDGRTLRQALTDCGLGNVPVHTLDTQRYIGYVEAHIEQGPYLEIQELQIGVVTSIVGMLDFEIIMDGEQNHAGTTPMAFRRDAGLSLIRLANVLDQRMAESAGKESVWTIGNVAFEPGAPSIVPGRATMLWQFRDPDQSRVETFRSITEDIVSEFQNKSKLKVTLKLRDESASAQQMDERLQSCLAAAAENCCPGKWTSMPSGASHDAQVLAQVMPSAMLFIPSIGGISHSFEEDSKEQDIVLGCQVLAQAVSDSFLVEW